MSLLAPASCDQPLGITGAVVLSVCMMMFVVGALGRAGDEEGCRGWESETREYPMRTRETPWQLETWINTKWGTPIHLAGTQSQMTGIERRGRGCGSGARVGKYLNECWRVLGILSQQQMLMSSLQVCVNEHQL